MKNNKPAWTVTVCKPDGTLHYAEMFCTKRGAKIYVQTSKRFTTGYTFKITRNANA